MDCKNVTKHVDKLLMSSGCQAGSKVYKYNATLLSFLLQMSVVSHGYRKSQDQDFKYSSPETMILEIGRIFDRKKLEFYCDDDHDECCECMAYGQSSDMVYCEGYILVPKSETQLTYKRGAWLWNPKTDQIFDNEIFPFAYVGVPLKQSFVNAMHDKNGEWGVLTDTDLLVSGFPPDAIYKFK